MDETETPAHSAENGTPSEDQPARNIEQGPLASGDGGKIPTPPTSTRADRGTNPGSITPDANRAGPKRPGALKLTEYQRVTLARTCDFWGDEMLRTIEDRDAFHKENPGDEEVQAIYASRRQWMGDQAAGWYSIAEAVREGKGVK